MSFEPRIMDGPIRGLKSLTNYLAELLDLGFPVLGIQFVAVYPTNDRYYLLCVFV